MYGKKAHLVSISVDIYRIENKVSSETDTSKNDDPREWLK